MDKIINKIISQSPDKIPAIPNNITKNDLNILQDAIKKNMGKKVQVNILRLIAAQCYIQLDMNGYLKHLLDINFPQIEQQKFAPQARLRICQGIIQADQIIRSHTVLVHLQAFDQQKHINPQYRGRIQVIRSGLNCLQNNFYKAAIQLLGASRQECFVRDEKKKIQLINQSIAFAFISPKNPQLHKLICSLYINENVKKSQLYPIVSKLYSEDMINNTDQLILKKLLPQRMQKKDTDGVSILSRAMFSHNMLAIINSFSSISFKSATQLIGLPIDEMLLMIQKTYRNGQLEVDQKQGFIYINESQNQIQVKRWFDSIEQVLGQEV